MATATDEFKEMKSTGRARGMCPGCGKRPTKGFIKIDVLAYGDEKSAKGARHIKSKSRSLCATCIKRIYPKILKEFTKEVGED